ncbi:unnamed protein product [Malus baccata var. baccata]
MGFGFASPYFRSDLPFHFRSIDSIELEAQQPSSPSPHLISVSNSGQPPAHHHTILSPLTLQPSFTTQPPPRHRSLSRDLSLGTLDPAPAPNSAATVLYLFFGLRLLYIAWRSSDSKSSQKKEIEEVEEWAMRDKQLYIFLKKTGRCELWWGRKGFKLTDELDG